MHVLRNHDAHDLGLVVTCLDLSRVSVQIVCLVVRVVVMHLELIFGIIDGHKVRVTIAVNVTNCHDLHSLIVFWLIESKVSIVKAYEL